MQRPDCFPFNPSRRGFADQMIAILNEAPINGITVNHVQKAAPPLNQVPKQPKRGKGMVANHPFENASSARIYGDPDPDFTDSFGFRCVVRF